MQLILVGQPELLRRLMAPNLRQFNERIGARTLLAPLDASETQEYIDYRLRSKGGTAAKIFNRKALQYIVAASAGIPRRVNVLSHNAMLLAYAAGAKQVSLKMAKEAVADYQDLFTAAIKASSSEHTIPRDSFRLWWHPGVTAVAAALVSLLIALVVFGSHLGRNRSVAIPEESSIRDQASSMPQSQLQMHPAMNAAASAGTPIAVPDYTASADSNEPAAVSSPKVSPANSKSKRTAVRLAKQRISADEDEDE